MEEKNSNIVKVIDSLVGACINQRRFDDAERVIRLGASVETIDCLVEAYANEGRFDDTQRVAKKLGGRSLLIEEIDCLIRAGSRKGRIDDVQKAIKLRGRDISMKEIIRLTHYVKRLWASQTQ